MMMSKMFCQVYVADCSSERRGGTNRSTRTACRHQINNRKLGTGSPVIIEVNAWNRQDAAVHRQIISILKHRRNI